MNAVNRIREYLDEQHVIAAMNMDTGWATRSVLVVGPWALDELDRLASGGPFGFPRGKMKADIERGTVMIHGVRVMFHPSERTWRVDEIAYSGPPASEVNDE